MGDVPLSGQDLLLVVKQKSHKNRPRGTGLEMKTPRPAREVARR